MARPIKRPTLAQVTISHFMSSKPASGSVLTAWSLEPASDPVSPSLSAPPRLTLCLFLSKINEQKKKKEERKVGRKEIGRWVSGLVGRKEGWFCVIHTEQLLLSACNMASLVPHTEQDVDGCR